MNLLEHVTEYCSQVARKIFVPGKKLEVFEETLTPY